MKLAIIDDDSEYLESFKNLTANDFIIQTFVSGGEALRQVDRLSECDAILVDVHLKDDTGFGVLDKLKSTGVVGPTLIFLSEDNSIGTRLLGLRMGVSDFLTKSMCLEELKLRIKNSVAVRRGTTNVRIGNLVLDQDQMTCRLDGKNEDINITKIEFQILRQLFRTPNGILKGDLEHLLWKDTMTVPNTLNTHLHNLNAKFANWDHSIKITREGLTQIRPRLRD